MVWKSKLQRNAGEVCGLCEHTNLPRVKGISNEDFLNYAKNNPLICTKTNKEVENDGWCEEFETAKEILDNLPSLPDKDEK